MKVIALLLIWSLSLSTLKDSIESCCKWNNLTNWCCPFAAASVVNVNIVVAAVDVVVVIVVVVALEDVTVARSDLCEVILFVQVG